MPRLHISLGVFMKLWSLLEMECHKLHLTLAQHIKGNTDDKEGFRKYATLIHELEELAEQQRQHTQLAALLDIVVTAAALQLSEESNQQNPHLQQLQQEAIHVREQVDKIVCNLRTCNSVILK